ncbi:ABC transporter substrate-binding protein [Phytoactinopolyspora halotolerans]|uniref:Carbohydrate ABC transporter substrate-binding protein n=1 Tax=Phytoactinopolyspora halotolerans TaxID=1981512 RepID=A0A6L9SHI7_9ACTN|nr:ABC transporter substrate-binding protein [Phytoactinopolyspora halotolerans]NEE04593.1 carbohydrate ABC transporter substrate-binding protein [Phytoactinopolyspora halotolerans]
MSKSRMTTTTATVAIASAAAVMAGVAGCGSDGGSSASDSSADTSGDSGEIVITCATCQESPTDPFLQYNYEAAQRFNEEFAGTYRVETIENANAGSSDDRLQYYQRLALADDLPDLFQLNSGEIKALQETGRLHDFASTLENDDEWAATFHDQAFDALMGAGGEIWAIPQQRDAIGIYYNTELLENAGFAEFPATWDEFEDLAAELRSQDKVAIAMDGDWATMLMWVNLIGTQPGGAEFLREGIVGSDNWGDDPTVVQATERLRDWHVEGYVNADAFSGEFQNAAAPYLTEEAAMVANGPWFVNTNLKTDSAAPGLYEKTGYAAAPGWSEGDRGAVVVSGAGWVSGTTDEQKLEAVETFVKFVSSEDEVLRQATATGANPPVQVDAAAAEEADLEPLATGLIEEAAESTYRYPHVRVHGPAGFGAAWKNLWPAYVKGEMATDEFLQRLTDDAMSDQTG